MLQMIHQALRAGARRMAAKSPIGVEPLEGRALLSAVPAHVHVARAGKAFKAGYLELDGFTYNAFEGDTITINVWRTDGSSGAVGVDYTIGPGVATVLPIQNPRTELFRSGHLDFAPGQTQASILVPTTDDGAVRPSAELQITLTKPTGGARFRGIGFPEASIFVHEKSRPVPRPPKLVDLQASIDGQQLRSVSLRFDGPLDVTETQKPYEYNLYDAGRDGRLMTGDDRTIRFASATYDTATGVVTLTPRGKVSLKKPIVFDFVSAPLIAGRQGIADLDGDGWEGGGYTAVLGTGGVIQVIRHH